MNSPFDSTGTTTNKAKKIDWDVMNDSAVPAADESAFRELPPADGRGSLVILGQFDTKRQTIDENWWVVMVCSVASFLCLCQANVDSSGRK